MSRRGWALFVAMSVIWGVPYLLIKVAVGDFSPVVVVFLRCVIGAALLLPWTIARGRLRHGPAPALAGAGGLHRAGDDDAVAAAVLGRDAAVVLAHRAAGGRGAVRRGAHRPAGGGGGPALPGAGHRHGHRRRRDRGAARAGHRRRPVERDRRRRPRRHRLRHRPDDHQPQAARRAGRDRERLRPDRHRGGLRPVRGAPARRRSPTPGWTPGCRSPPWAWSAPRSRWRCSST